MVQQQTQVQVTKFSKLPKLEGLEVIQGSIPEPREGEVLCRIILRPVNPTDVHAVQGLRPIGPHHTPHIAGGEGQHFSMHFILTTAFGQSGTVPAPVGLHAIFSTWSNLFAGVAKVVKLGQGVTSLKEGQRVVGIPWTGLYGTWQQYRTMPAESLVS